MVRLNVLSAESHASSKAVDAVYRVVKAKNTAKVKPATIKVEAAKYHGAIQKLQIVPLAKPSGQLVSHLVEALISDQEYHNGNQSKTNENFNRGKHQKYCPGAGFAT